MVRGWMTSVSGWPLPEFAAGARLRALAVELVGS